MHRAVQVGIAVLVLSVRVWHKLFFISDYFGKGVNGSFTNENITKGLIIFFLGYYIMVKVFQ